MFKNATFLSFYFADNQLLSNSETLVIYILDMTLNKHSISQKIFIKMLKNYECDLTSDFSN
jgi:hypothetical protein